MRVLITGATGFIGSRLTAICLQRNIAVNYLTRKKNSIETKLGAQGFYWNPQKQEIDLQCLEGVHAVINLAGANLFKPWTKSYKNTLLQSRTQALDLLYKSLRDHDNEVEQLVSASAIGIYPSSFQKIYNEEWGTTDQSFVGKLVSAWENAADRFSGIGIDVAKIRTGIVLGKNGGALSPLKFSIKNYVGAPLGNGKQWQSWIHIDDLVGIYLFAVTKRLDGTYNAVARHPITNEELTTAIARHLKKPLWLPKIPKIVIKTLFGEMAGVVLSSQLVESKKIEQMGYRFEYTSINKALETLL